jgi:hypothetical protein
MRGRERGATIVVVTLLTTVGLALPGTAAARSFAPPASPVAGGLAPAVTITVAAPDVTDASYTFATVSWSD